MDTLYSVVDETLTYLVWHPGHDHELVGHGVHVVNLKREVCEFLPVWGRFPAI